MPASNQVELVLAGGDITQTDLLNTIANTTAVFLG
ncbi:MAG: hypothetical protein ACJAVK_000411 [Akkermansiaceae bacterium]|jgi:hypothetical protein